MHCLARNILGHMGKIVIKLKDGLSCTGCEACVNACPKKCISMIEDAEGFLVPAINTETCVGCSKCESVCKRAGEIDLNPRPKSAIAAWSKDPTIRGSSSSGGVFSELASQILKKGGAVNGVSFDKEFSLVQRLIFLVDDLCRVRGSRYVQSYVGNVYAEIKTLLDSGRKVFFTSTPCQVAGLKGFLGREYENLVTCDFICHGVPSPSYFKQYVEKKISASGRGDARDFCFRDLQGWGWNPSLVFADGSRLKYFTYSDEYMLPFLAGLNYRESCYKCRFARPERCADITIGDFWSIKDYSIFTEKYEKGCSLVLLNTEKAKDLFALVRYKCEVRLMPLSSTRANDQLWEPSSRPSKRDSFYADAKAMEGKAFAEKYGFYNKKRHPLHAIADCARWVRRKLGALKFLILVKTGLIKI